MKYNIYKLTMASNNGYLQKITTPHDNRVDAILKKIENQIILEYLQEQKHNYGITSIGNRIRNNETLKNTFGVNHDDFTIIKLTENQRSFYEVFINSLSLNPENLYFFILEKEFGKNSQIVDGSFISLKTIEKKLRNLFKNLKLIDIKQNIYFIEMNNFTEYVIKKNGIFSKIIKK